MMDGSDAVSDWPPLNALLNTGAAPPGSACTTAAASVWATASIAAWSSSATAPRPDERLSRVLWNDPATGVMRHADAGYAIAQQCARDNA